MGVKLLYSVYKAMRKMNNEKNTIEQTIGALGKPFASGSVGERAISGILWLLLVLVIGCLTLGAFGAYYFKDVIVEQQKISREQLDFQRQIKSQMNNYEQIIIIGRKVYEKLKENLTSIKANRLLVVGFHDVKDNDTTQKLFATARNWQPIDAINDKSRRFRDQSMSHFSDLIDQFAQNRCWTVPKLSAINPVHRFWIDRGSRSIIACPIKDFNLNLAGMLVAEYDAPFDEAEGYILESRVSQLAAILGGVGFSQEAIQSKQ